MIDIKKLKEHLYDVVGAIGEVAKEMGPGLNEYCYQEALEMQFEKDKITFVREKTFHPIFCGTQLKAVFRVDFLCKNDIVLECKSVPELISVHRAQLFNYMRLTKSTCGVLVNFYPNYYETERYFYDDEQRVILGVDGRIIKGYN